MTLLLKTVPFFPGQVDGVLELVAEEVVVVIEVPEGISLVELEFTTPEVDEEKLAVEDSSSDEVVEMFSSADEDTLLRVVVALPGLVDVNIGSTFWLVVDTSGVVVELDSGSSNEEVADVAELAREVVDEASGIEVVLLPQSSQREKGDVVGRSEVLILVEEVTVTFTVSTPDVTVLYEVVVLKPSIVLVWICQSTHLRAQGLVTYRGRACANIVCGNRRRRTTSTTTYQACSIIWLCAAGLTLGEIIVDRLASFVQIRSLSHSGPHCKFAKREIQVGYGDRDYA